MKMRLLLLFLLLVAVQASASPVSASKAASMQAALDDLSIALINHGYQLVKVQPVDSALTKRGFADPGVRIAFVGKAEQVRQALDVDPALLNLLPLRLTMERTGDVVRISSDDLDLWRKSQPAGSTVIESWQVELADILADYARQ